MSQKKIFLIGAFISVIAEAFIIYIIYFNPHHISSLYAPATQTWVNAIFNSLSAVSLATAIFFIKKKNINKHKLFIHLAFAFSALFLVNYILYHMSVGHVRFTNMDYRTPYLIILATHLLSSVIGLPLIFITYLLGLFSHVEIHKKFGKFVFILWEYISVTGVLVVLMLKFLNKV